MELDRLYNYYELYVCTAVFSSEHTGTYFSILKEDYKGFR